MKVMGHNLFAILGAAVAIYAVGFIIYGMLVPPELWMESQGITQAQLDAVGTSRMPYGALPPLVTAIALAVLFGWAKVSSMTEGMRYGAIVAVASALPAIWYGWVYGVGGCTGPAIDSAHLLVGHVAAGAILGRWR